MTEEADRARAALMALAMTEPSNAAGFTNLLRRFDDD